MTGKGPFVVGIDLGTTNSVLAFARGEGDTLDEPSIEVLPVPQVVAPGEVEARPILPSFLYLAGAGELPPGSLDLPWSPGRDFAVGAFAQARGAEVPGRLVSSAKSWLCHGGVDRTAPILPWGAEEEARRLSPVAASAATLAHMAAAWNHYNGGVMKGGALVTRLTEVLGRWGREAGSSAPAPAEVREAAPRVLTGTDLDLAVARGAVYHGLARRGRGVRIRGGAARSYYIGIETAMPAVPGLSPPTKALCIAPFGMEEGTEAEIAGREFGLAVGEPTAFRLLHSTTRRRDEVGTIVEEWEPGEIEESAPLETTLAWEGQEGTTVPVRLRVSLTEIGTLDVWCEAREGGRRWKLEFDVRALHRGEG